MESEQQGQKNPTDTIPENLQQETRPHPSLVLLAKILQMVGPTRDAETGYEYVITALEMALTLLRAGPSHDDDLFQDKTPLPSVDLAPWLKSEFFRGSH